MYPESPLPYRGNATLFVYLNCDFVKTKRTRRQDAVGMHCLARFAIEYHRTLRAALHTVYCFVAINFMRNQTFSY